MENSSSKKITAANVITTCRIVFSILLLCFPAFSVPFYVLYTLAGITDMIDGPIARKGHTESEFGSKLDSVADIIFVAAGMIKVIPTLYLPVWILVWVALIIGIRCLSTVLRFRKYHRFVTVHSTMNRICGVALFAVPLLLGLKISRMGKLLVVVIACAVATAGAILSFFLHFVHIDNKA